jgi:hypothetical protein
MLLQVFDVLVGQVDCRVDFCLGTEASKLQRRDLLEHFLEHRKLLENSEKAFDILELALRRETLLQDVKNPLSGHDLGRCSSKLEMGLDELLCACKGCNNIFRGSHFFISEALSDRCSHLKENLSGGIVKFDLKDVWNSIEEACNVSFELVNCGLRCLDFERKVDEENFVGFIL